MMNQVIMNGFVDEVEKISRNENAQFSTPGMGLGAVGAMTGSGIGTRAGILATKKGRRLMSSAYKYGKGGSNPASSAGKAFATAARKYSTSGISRGVARAGQIGGAVAGGYAAYRLGKKLFGKRLFSKG